MDRLAGTSVDGTAHLAQSIGDILSTPMGTRVMRRDYGSMLFDLIDQPLNGVTKLLLYASTAIALRRWEPRIRLRKVSIDTAETDAARGKVSLLIEGDRTDVPAANSRVTLSIPIRAGGLAPVAA